MPFGTSGTAKVLLTYCLLNFIIYTNAAAGIAAEILFAAWQWRGAKRLQRIARHEARVAAMINCFYKTVIVKFYSN
jgi:hypothetical protein